MINFPEDNLVGYCGDFPIIQVLLLIWARDLRKELRKNKLLRFKGTPFKDFQNYRNVMNELEPW